MAKDNKTMWIIVIGIALLLFWYGGNQGWFKSISNITYSTVNQETKEILENEQTGDCTLSLDKTSINIGDAVRGTIQDGTMAFCEVFSQKNGIWNKEFEGTTDINGDLSGSKVLVVGGTYLVKALCGAGTEKECVTNGVTLIVGSQGDSDGDGYPNTEEIDKGTDPNDPEDYPGHRVCGKIKSPAFQTTCDVAVSCSSGYKCTFHMEGGLGGDRWCSCDKTTDVTDFCVGLNKGYISGREVDSCSYCNYINEICEINPSNNDVYCCMRESFEVGCNDLDFTKSNFDNSLKTSTSCTDDAGTHLDSCSGGLLDEWYCTDAMDVCKHTFYNCENMLGSGYYCSGGVCLYNTEMVNCDIACDSVTGAGSQSIPFSMIPIGFTCVDYPSTQCSNGVYNIGNAGTCCCWNCK